jgi:predicted dehydrogenase
MLLDRINWGILGTSKISNTLANAIKESDISQLSAIGSRSLDKAQAFAEEFSIPRFYGTPQALLDDPDIDVVYIGLPNHLHKEWIIRCAQAGKHVLCDKPFVVNSTQANEVFNALVKTNIFCMEGLMYRCHPFIAQLKELIKNKTIGNIKFFNATYTANIAAVANATAGGSILNLGCYPVSLVRLLAGADMGLNVAEPVAITAQGRMNSTKFNDSQASVLLKFANDAQAMITVADDLDMYSQFEIVGTKGRLHVLTNPWLPGLDNRILISRDGMSMPEEINVSADKSLFRYQIDVVGHSILEGKTSAHTPGISWEDTLGNMAVLTEWKQQVHASFTAVPA